MKKIVLMILSLVIVFSCDDENIDGLNAPTSISYVPYLSTITTGDEWSSGDIVVEIGKNVALRSFEGYTFSITEILLDKELYSGDDFLIDRRGVIWLDKGNTLEPGIYHIGVKASNQTGSFTKDNAIVLNVTAPPSVPLISLKGADQTIELPTFVNKTAKITQLDSVKVFVSDGQLCDLKIEPKNQFFLDLIAPTDSTQGYAMVKIFKAAHFIDGEKLDLEFNICNNVGAAEPKIVSLIVIEELKPIIVVKGDGDKHILNISDNGTPKLNEIPGVSIDVTVAELSDIILSDDRFEVNGENGHIGIVEEALFSDKEEILLTLNVSKDEISAEEKVIAIKVEKELPQPVITITGADNPIILNAGKDGKANSLELDGVRVSVTECQLSEIVLSDGRFILNAEQGTVQIVSESVFEVDESIDLKVNVSKDGVAAEEKNIFINVDREVIPKPVITVSGAGSTILLDVDENGFSKSSQLEGVIVSVSDSELSQIVLSDDRFSINSTSGKVEIVAGSLFSDNEDITLTLNVSRGEIQADQKTISISVVFDGAATEIPFITLSVNNSTLDIGEDNQATASELNGVEVASVNVNVNDIVLSGDSRFSLNSSVNPATVSVVPGSTFVAGENIVLAFNASNEAGDAIEKELTVSIRQLHDELLYAMDLSEEATGPSSRVGQKQISIAGLKAQMLFGAIKAGKALWNVQADKVNHPTGSRDRLLRCVGGNADLVADPAYNKSSSILVLEEAIDVSLLQDLKVNFAYVVSKPVDLTVQRFRVELRVVSEEDYQNMEALESEQEKRDAVLAFKRITNSMGVEPTAGVSDSSGFGYYQQNVTLKRDEFPISSSNKLRVLVHFFFDKNGNNSGYMAAQKIEIQGTVSTQ